MGKFNMESFETIMSLVNDPGEYKKKIDALNEKIKKADDAVANMYAEQSQLNIRKEELEEAFAANHKAKSQADKSIEYEQRLKAQNQDDIRTAESRKKQAEEKIKECKKIEKEAEAKIKTLKTAQANLDAAKADFEERVNQIEAKEQKIIEFAKTLS